MAVTWMWPVKSSLTDTINYIENPDKTSYSSADSGIGDTSIKSIMDHADFDSADHSLLVTGIGCTPAGAAEEMNQTRLKWGKTGGIVAFHGYQSFAEGEITPELAHMIGCRLAEELWGDRYEVVVATHTDKKTHIHNHFVVNSVSFIDGMKYYLTKRNCRLVFDVSNRLCREYGLSVIEHPRGKRRSYGEWLAEKNGKPTYRKLIRDDIDRAVASSLTITEFYGELEKMGYEIKLFGESGRVFQHPSLKPPGSELFFRFDRLGEDYSLGEISERILENTSRKVPFPEETREAVRRYRTDHPPKTEARGIAKLYYYYCYELHIIVRYPGCVQRVSHFMREDIRKLEQLDAQTIFLTENGIETFKDLEKYRERAKEDILNLQSDRKSLRNELSRVIRRGDEAEVIAVKSRISDIAEQLKKLRKGCAMCDIAEQRASQMQAELELIRNDNREKEEMNDGLFRGSGRTGREDEPQRSRSRS